MVAFTIDCGSVVNGWPSGISTATLIVRFASAERERKTRARKTLLALIADPFLAGGSESRLPRSAITSPPRWYSIRCHGPHRRPLGGGAASVIGCRHVRHRARG